MQTLKQIYSEARRRLEAAGVDDPAFDAGCIIEHHTGVKRFDIILRGDRAPSCDPKDIFADISRREHREPLQYIIGTWPFYGLDFFVGKGVLIPRQDTELLAQTAIDFLNNRRSPKFLELCAGSGCVSTAVLKNVENSAAVCVELSKDASFYLKKNLDFHGLTKKTHILNADMLLPQTAASLLKNFGKFDAIVCNPPYIKRGDIDGLQPEVAEFEPRLALDGGGDGLVFYKAFGLYAPLLKLDGIAAFEVGMGQAGDVAALLDGFGLKNIFIKKDYSGIERTVGGFAV